MGIHNGVDTFIILPEDDEENEEYNSDEEDVDVEEKNCGIALIEKVHTDFITPTLNKYYEKYADQDIKDKFFGVDG